MLYYNSPPKRIEVVPARAQKSARSDMNAMLITKMKVVKEGSCINGRQKLPPLKTGQLPYYTMITSVVLASKHRSVRQETQGARTAVSLTNLFSSQQMSSLEVAVDDGHHLMAKSIEYYRSYHPNFSGPLS